MTASSIAPIDACRDVEQGYATCVFGWQRDRERYHCEKLGTILERIPTRRNVNRTSTGQMAPLNRFALDDILSGCET